MKNFKIFGLNWQDIIQGTIIMFISALITAFYECFDQNGFNITMAEVNNILKVSILAGLAFLVKNLIQVKVEAFKKKDKNENEE